MEASRPVQTYVPREVSIFSQSLFVQQFGRALRLMIPADLSAIWGTLTDAERDELERRMPGRSIIAFQVPDNFAPGPALLTMTMRFRCNITQEAFPIVEERSIPFEVLP